MARSSEVSRTYFNPYQTIFKQKVSDGRKTPGISVVKIERICFKMKLVRDFACGLLPKEIIFRQVECAFFDVQLKPVVYNSAVRGWLGYVIKPGLAKLGFEISKSNLIHAWRGARLELLSL